MFILCLLIFSICISKSYTNLDIAAGTNPKNYGPYIYKLIYYNTCKGPKPTNLTYVETDYKLEKNGIYMGMINFTILEPTRIEEAKVFVYSIKGNKKTLLWNYKVEKPCQHYVLAAIIEQHLGVGKNCIAKKANHYCVINFTETTKNFVGPTFFYGEFVFKILVLSKDGNITCFIFKTQFSKA